jgi:hypothetical protein
MDVEMIPSKTAVPQIVVLALASLAPLAARAQPADELAQVHRLLEQQSQLLRQQAAALQTLQTRLQQLEATQRGSPAPRSGSRVGQSEMAQSQPRSSPPQAFPTQAAPGPGPGPDSMQGPGTTPQAIGQQPGATGRNQAATRNGAVGIIPQTGQDSPATNPQAIDQQPGAPGTPAALAQSGGGNSPAQGQPALPVLSGNDRVKVTLSGQVNRALLLHGDGSGKVDSYFTDYNTSSTRLRLLGAAQLDSDVTAISALEFDLRSNSSGSVSRATSNNNGGDTPILGPFRVRRAEVGVQSQRFGNVLFGRGSTFSDGIADLDLSGTDVALYAYGPDSYGGLQFANEARPFRRSTDPTMSQVFDDFDGPRDDRIRYDTPKWRGFTFGASVSQGPFWDLGIRYAVDISGAKIVAGIAYQNLYNTEPRSNPLEGSSPYLSLFSQRAAGSFSILLPNGLNATISSGWGKHHNDCCDAANVATRDWFTKIGYQAHIFSFGTTNFSIDGGQTHDRIRNGDIATRVGFAVNQPISSLGVELFAAYERLMLHRSGASFRDSDIGVVGSRIQF